jgi:hypothetical protein
MIFYRPRTLFLMAAGFMLVTACKKDPIQYTFEGTVTESVNGNALNDVLVKISQRVYNGSVASAFFNNAGSKTTSSDGKYEITFDREKVFEFKVDMTKSGYFDMEQIIGSADVSTEENKVVNYEMEPKSWLTLHLQNVGGMTSDEFAMIHYNFRTGCAGCTSNTFFYYNGIVDTTFTIMSTGGVYATYSYKNPGATIYQQDSVYMIPFDTAFVEIQY